MLTNYLHCTVPCIKKNYYRSGEQIYANGNNIQQFKTGWWLVPLTELASFQASKFGRNTYVQTKFYLFTNR